MRLRASPSVKLLAPGTGGTVADGDGKGAIADEPFITCPRSSPSLCSAVWTLKYQRPAWRSAAPASVKVVSPLIGLARFPESGTTGGALAPAAAGPWK